MAASRVVFAQKMQMPACDVDGPGVFGRPETDNSPANVVQLELHLICCRVDESHSRLLADRPCMHAAESAIDTDRKEQIVRSAQSIELPQEVVNRHDARQLEAALGAKARDDGKGRKIGVSRFSDFSGS